MKVELLCLSCEHNEGEGDRGFMYYCPLLGYYVNMNHRRKEGRKTTIICEAERKGVGAYKKKIK